MSPVTELRQAAATLRDTAAPASDLRPGPWSTMRNGVVWLVRTVKGKLVAETPHWADGRLVAWIALMSPDKAEPLAAWLESCAKYAARVSDPRNQEIIADPHALTLARLINGGGRDGA